ncbi:hypothetical protein DFH06DRAFT_1087334 [Mycena polygramma]|nr:hypothetical protein DFH06DRAFT_1087334 [Mycena polygramma]
MPPMLDSPREIIEIEDSSESERGEDELEDGVVAEPTTDITHRFEAVVKEGFTYDGNFGFSTRYTMHNAANPCLNIDGLGTVGLPLSPRDALAIISVARSTTTGIWELPAEKIHFDDPAWDAWIREVPGSAACSALQPESDTVSHSYSLRKLVIHGPGSQRTEFQDEPGLSNSKMADLVVVLPSTFEGGQLQLRHGLQTNSFDLASRSGIFTSVIAAYVGVWHTLYSVTAGYRLSLVYDINQDTTVPRLPDTDGAAQRLRSILQSWEHDAQRSSPDVEAPKFLACLLSHTYAVKDKVNFNTEMLRGADGPLVSHLSLLAQELQFRVSFAQVTLTVRLSASAERFAQNRHYGYQRYDDSESDDSIDEEHFDIDEEPEEGDEESMKFRVTKVVDLSGLPIDVNPGLEVADLLNGSMTSGHPDDEVFDKDERTSATVIRTYNRTVLLLWPKAGSLESEVEVGDVCNYVSNALRDSVSTAPTAREKELIDMLEKSCQRAQRDAKKLQRVVHVLRQSADRWDDVQEFVRGLLACRVDQRTNLLGVEGFVSAYKAFGWVNVLKDFFEKAMTNDQSNSRRQTLLLRMSTLATEENNLDLVSWCKIQEDHVLRHLSKLDAKQLPWLMELSRSRGAEFLRDVIFPQLRSQNLDKEFWIPFLHALQESTALIPNASLELMEGLALQCFSETARNACPFPTKKATPRYRGESVSEEADCEPILEVVKFLVETHHEDMCARIFTAMRDAKNGGTYNSKCPPWQYYVKLAPTFEKLFRSSVPASSAIFQSFFADVVDSLISADPNIRVHRWDEPTAILDSDNLWTLRAAARMAGGLSTVKSSLISANLNRHSSSALQEFARAIHAEFRPKSGLATPEYDVVIITVARAAVDAFDTKSLIPGNSPVSRLTYSNDSPAERMLGLVKFCFEVGALDVCQHLLGRFVPPPKGATIERHISTALSPFLPLLRNYLATRRLDFQTEPFKKFAATVITGFAGKVMSQRHTDFVPVQLRDIGCRCDECSALKEFFLGDLPSTSIHRTQQIRQHVEGQLHSAGAKSFGINWDLVRSGRLYALNISKPSNMTPQGLRSSNRKNGEILLAMLGDEQMQQSILGPDYDTVKAQITGANGQKRQLDGSGPQSGAKKLRLS